MASGYRVVWPKVRMNLTKGGPKILDKGTVVTADEAKADHLDMLASFGALQVVQVLDTEDSGQGDADQGSEGSGPVKVDDILAQVGDDPEKAKVALDAEHEERGEKARKSLVKALEDVIAQADDGTGDD